MWAVRAFMVWIQKRNSIASDKCPVYEVSQVEYEVSLVEYEVSLVEYEVSLVYIPDIFTCVSMG